MHRMESNLEQDETGHVFGRVFDLPIDIRLLIYRQLFADLTLPIHIPVSASPATSILSTNHQIKQEAIPIIYHPTNFRVDYSQLWQLLHSSFPASARLPPDRDFSKIRSIVIDRLGYEQLRHLPVFPAPEPAM
jgi:hypothetical protein